MSALLKKVNKMLLSVSGDKESIVIIGDSSLSSEEIIDNYISNNQISDRDYLWVVIKI